MARVSCLSLGLVPYRGGEVPSGPQWLPGVSRAGCGFRVGWHTAGGVWFLFFGGFLLVLAGLAFWLGDWALGCHSMKFRQFPDIS